MNFNPFTKQLYSSSFGRYPKKLSIFDRIVGRPGQMGLLDYLLVAPLIFKSLYHASKKILPLRIFFGALTTPFAIAKFAIFIPLSPFALLGWLLSEFIKSKKAKRAADRKQSAHTIKINKLMVKDINPYNASKPLSAVNQLFDKDLNHYSIKMDNKKKLILTRFPSGQHVATFDASYENVKLIKELMGARENRAEYFLNNAGNNIFDFNVFDWITAQATAHFNLLHKIVLGAKDGREINPDNPTSFANVVKPVRNIILQHVIALETEDYAAADNDGQRVKSKNQFFNLFTREDRQDAQVEYLKGVTNTH